ncbi:MAG: acetyl/propionyl/methylcrotonyl-CoA carboxylase subunit alpha [Fidelibacterota bacterium]
MVTKILIANRGEIAVRIIRTCREMGLETVAVFSEPDRVSPHVLMASEAYPIGPAPSADSYLRADKILEVAKKSGADCVHPGYGFLSENVSFATAVQEAGLTWIGPPPESMAQMGDKIAARSLARDLNVPVIPGSDQPLVSPEQAEVAAQSVGFPVLVKAVGGGGGKGMRIVNNPRELSDALTRASSEATSSFSDERVFLEKYLPHPRHIEIQVVADAHGSVAAFPERECSIQRRYQKIIEESPSPFVTPGSRKKLVSWAKKITSECGYRGVGTVEFLADEKGNFFFLEMNTRLQVEHPVTEMISGVDLVREQIRVSSGEKLSLVAEGTPAGKDALVKTSGQAIECRIYAEDGFRNFIPSTGTVLGLEIPDGFGTRFDHGLRVGQEITPHYDPLLGKLITWGITRKGALNRMKRALKECHIVGVETTVPFCYAVLSHPRFDAGDIHTHFIPEEMDRLKETSSRDRESHRQIASVLAAIHAWDTSPVSSHDGSRKESLGEKSEESVSRWKSSGRKDALR